MRSNLDAIKEIIPKLAHGHHRLYIVRAVDGDGLGQPRAFTTQAEAHAYALPAVIDVVTVEITPANDGAV